jgi:hypothetical protein
MQVKILCAVKSTSIPIYVPGVQRVATPANGHRLRCGCRREDAKKRRHPCRSAIPGAFPLDLTGFHVYTFLAGGGWSSCPFSTRLRVLKLEQPSDVTSFCHSLTTARAKSHLSRACFTSPCCTRRSRARFCDPGDSPASSPPGKRVAYPPGRRSPCSASASLYT